MLMFLIEERFGFALILLLFTFFEFLMASPLITHHYYYIDLSYFVNISVVCDIIVINYLNA